MNESASLFYAQEVNAREFYLLLYSIALRTLLFSPLETRRWHARSFKQRAGSLEDMDFYLASFL